MIVELSVENLAIIERCDIALGPGFTVFTGETGAGKSLLVDALELAFGARSSSGVVRSGAARALVQVTVDLTFDSELQRKCAELGAEVQEGMLYLQREVFAEGKSQCRIGGRPAPMSQLKEVGKLLVDLHGQHNHQSLLDPQTHLGYLDAWIGAEVLLLIDRASLQLEKFNRLESRLNLLRGGQREREQKLDLLNFQIREIESVAPKVGEVAQLEMLLARLQHAERLYEVAASVREMLSEGDSAGRDCIAAAHKALSEAQRLDPVIEKISAPLEQATILLNEAIAELGDYIDSIEISPKLLEETADRIEAIKKLFRKYGDDEAAVLRFLESANSELHTLTSDESNEEELEAAMVEARVELDVACHELTAKRKTAAEIFSAYVATQLHDLGMDRANFDVSFKPKNPNPDGADEVEFLFTANVGEPLRALAKIASGGEISRVMLAIKTALMGRAGVPTLVFDEVDTGLGGKAAATVARKLEELAEHNQIIVITHLPQIAGRATMHYRVEKQEQGERTVAMANVLDEPSRVAEIARMLAGEKVGESALAHAKELLER